jgi:hypothetical protein
VITITVSRTGGFAGLARTWTVSISDDDAAEPHWQSLVDACPWDEWDQRDEAAQPVRQPDRYVYLIVANTHRAEVTEQSLTGPWRNLLDQVKEASG